jgi:hypothetical protein
VLVAIGIHKALVAFSLGLELATTSPRSARRPMLFMVLFSLISPVGIGVGMGVTGHVVEVKVQTLVSSILQSVATGTFLHVTFFEILGPHFAHHHRHHHHEPHPHTAASWERRVSWERMHEADPLKRAHAHDQLVLEAEPICVAHFDDAHLRQMIETSVDAPTRPQGSVGERHPQKIITSGLLLKIHPETLIEEDKDGERLAGIDTSQNNSAVDPVRPDSSRKAASLGNEEEVCCSSHSYITQGLTPTQDSDGPWSTEVELLKVLVAVMGFGAVAGVKLLDHSHGTSQHLNATVSR